MGQVLQNMDWQSARRVKAAKLEELGFVAACLAPGESGVAHSHTLVEEITVFQSGEGQIEIEDQCHPVCAGSVSVVPAGEFHCITNTGDAPLEMMVIFNRNVDRDAVVLKERDEHFADMQQAQVAGYEATINNLSEKVARLEAQISGAEVSGKKAKKGKKGKKSGKKS